MSNSDCVELQQLFSIAENLESSGLADQEQVLTILDTVIMELGKVQDGIDLYNEANEAHVKVNQDYQQVDSTIKWLQDNKDSATKTGRTELFNKVLRPAYENFGGVLNEYASKFADNETLQATYDGVALIFKSYGKTLESLGFTLPDLQALAQAAQEVEAKAEQAEVETATSETPETTPESQDK